MTTITLEDILNDENINSAIEYIEHKKGKPGRDGIATTQLREYWNNNKANIIESLVNGTYEPGIATQSEITSKKGKTRKIIILNTLDRMLSRVFSVVLSEHLDHELANSCYAYRAGKGTLDVAKFAAQKIEEKSIWVSEIDVENFFDTIRHELLFEKINQVINDERIIKVIQSFVNCIIENEEGQFRLALGLIQGMSLSPLLSNWYLKDIDELCEKKHDGYCRYGDDIRVFTKSKAEAIEIQKDITQLLNDIGLKVNSKKSGVYSAINRPCLGYEFFEKNNRVYISQITHKRGEVYNVWQKSVLKEINHHYYLLEDGVLSKKDFTIIFENEDGKSFLPIENIDSLSIYSNVVFSSNIFELLNQEGVSVSMISKNGELIGRFIPQKWKKNIKTELAQIKILTNENSRLELAKTYQYANVFNIRAALRYYKRRKDNDEINNAVNSVTDILEKITTAESINELMIYEAQARQKYFHCFNEIMTDDDFTFVTRNRRPPKDAINAMISFGNTLLYTRFAHEIYHSDLDIRFGILHSVYKNKENLNLDLADLFKPILVDRTIFTLVNKKMLNEVQDFEEKENGGIYMTNRAKRIFINEFNAKLAQTVTVKNKKITYEALLKQEVKNLKSYFDNNAEYKPYRYVN